MTSNVITLVLTKDEALVLFEWLASLDSSSSEPADDSAERNVLWKMESQLEKLLVEPLAANYQELVEDARHKIKGIKGDGGN